MCAYVQEGALFRGWVGGLPIRAFGGQWAPQLLIFFRPGERGARGAISELFASHLVMTVKRQKKAITAWLEGAI